MNLATPTPAKKKRRVWLWLMALIGVAFGYLGWRAYDASEARWEAVALGWYLDYTDPSEAIIADWKNTFKKETWMNAAVSVSVSNDEAVMQRGRLFQRLNPKSIDIKGADNLRDLSVLKGLKRLDELHVRHCKNLTSADALLRLTTLKSVTLHGCDQLSNVDGLKGQSSLERIRLMDCPRLTNVDGISALPNLKWILLDNCRGLKNVDALTSLPALETLAIIDSPGVTRESSDALKAAHPKAIITRNHHETYHR